MRRGRGEGGRRKREGTEEGEGERRLDNLLRVQRKTKGTEREIKMQTRAEDQVSGFL